MVAAAAKDKTGTGGGLAGKLRTLFLLILFVWVAIGVGLEWQRRRAAMRALEKVDEYMSIGHAYEAMSYLLELRQLWTDESPTRAGLLWDLKQSVPGLIDRRLAEAHVAMGEAYHAAKGTDLAFQHYVLAVLCDAQNPEIARELAGICIRERNYEVGLPAVKLARALDPDDMPLRQMEKHIVARIEGPAETP